MIIFKQISMEFRGGPAIPESHALFQDHGEKNDSGYMPRNGNDGPLVQKGMIPAVHDPTHFVC